MAQEYDHIFKIVLIGDPNVGKSNICLRYTKNDFDPENKTTIGVEFQSKSIKAADNEIIKA